MVGTKTAQRKACEVACEWCGGLFQAKAENKLTGLGGTPDSWICSGCLSIEPRIDERLDGCGGIRGDAMGMYSTP